MDKSMIPEGFQRALRRAAGTYDDEAEQMIQGWREDCVITDEEAAARDRHPAGSDLP